MRIALGDPDAPHAAQEGKSIAGAAAAEIRDALTLYRTLSTMENIDLRLHRAVLYNSIYRADDQFLVNQHIYGIPTAQVLRDEHVVFVHLAGAPRPERAIRFAELRERFRSSTARGGRNDTGISDGEDAGNRRTLLP